MHLSFPLRSAFVALPLEGETKKYFQEVQEALRSFEDILRLQKSDVPHLTLTFWKEMMDIEYQQVLGQSKAIAARTAPFELNIAGVELFSHRGEDRVLYLNVAFSPELATLKKLCPWPNEPGQPFHPHITLARVEHPQRFVRVRKAVMKALKGVAFPFLVDRLRLYANVDGKSQTPIAEFPFGQ